MNNRTLTTVGAVIIALLLISTVVALVSNAKKKRNLEAEKLRTEALVSEKQAVDQELATLKTDLAAVNDKADAGAKLLEAAEAELSEKNRRISYLVRTNSSLTKDKEAFEELKKVKADLDKEFSELKSNYENLTAERNNLENSVMSLESQKSDLVNKLQTLETYDSDNFEVYGSRGKKDKLTFWSCRTKKLNVNFEVPQSLTEAVSFKITTPSGTVITPDDKAMAWTISGDTPNFTASLSPVSGMFEQSREVSLTYTAKEKLTSGEYKIQIFSQERNIGNCRVRLK